MVILTSYSMTQFCSNAIQAFSCDRGISGHSIENKNTSCHSIYIRFDTKQQVRNSGF